MATANQSDFLGEGVNTGPRAPQGRPTTPDGLYYLDSGEPTPLWYQRVAGNQAAQNQTRSTNIASGALTGSGRDFSDAVVGGGYQAAQGGFVRPDNSTLLDALRGLGSNPIVNPIGYAATKAGGLADRALGTSISGYIQDPVGQGLNDLGAPDLVQAIANPTGYVNRTAVNSGTGYGTNVPAIVQNGVSAVRNLSNDAGNARSAVSGLQDVRLPSPGGNISLPAANGGGGLPTYQPLDTSNITPRYTQPGGNGGSGISNEARNVMAQAQQFASQNSAASASYLSQAGSYANRAAPQIARPDSSQMDAVYNAAMNFTPDISGAQRLEGMQMDMQGINNLESWSPEYSMQGVQNLESFNPDRTDRAIEQLYGYSPDNTLAGVQRLQTFDPYATRQGYESLDHYSPAESQAAAGRLEQIIAKPGGNLLDSEAFRQLQNFQGDRSGIDALNRYANEAEGPSRAEALLRAQSDADKRTALAIARSGRGGPAAVAQAQRQAISEGAAIAGETRGQAAVLRAQEFDAYKQRQLAALSQSGMLLSNAEAQRLSALQASGQLLDSVDQQKLAATQAYAQLKSTMDSQQLSAMQASGQLRSNYDAQRLSAEQAALQGQTNADSMRLGALGQAGQLSASGDSMVLNAKSNAAQLRGQMDAQSLSAISNAAQLRTAADQIRSSNLQAAGNIRIQGSGQQLGALSLAGNIATNIRSQDISVLQSNLSSSLQTMGMNDQQVRFFNQMAQDRDFQSQNIVQQAGALGINAAQAQAAMDLAWNQFAYQQLSDQQRQQYNYDALNSGNYATQQNINLNQQQLALQAQQTNNANARANRQEIAGYIGTGLSALGSVLGGVVGGPVGAAAGGALGQQLPQVPNYQLSMPQIGMPTPYTPTNYGGYGLGSSIGMMPGQGGYQLDPSLGQLPNVGYQPTGLNG